jgi:hypothetical protein
MILTKALIDKITPNIDPFDEAENGESGSVKKERPVGP